MRDAARVRGPVRGLAFQREFVQKVLVTEYFEAVEICFHSPHHLRLLKHLLGIGRRRRLLAPLDSRLASIGGDNCASGSVALRCRHLIEREESVGWRLPLELKDRQQIVWRTAHVREQAYLLGQHSQLLKVD